MTKTELKLCFDVKFEELYEYEGLKKLDKIFLENLYKKNSKLTDYFLSAKKFDSNLAIELSRLLEEFIVELFDIKLENSSLKKQHDDLKKIYYVRREFVQRHVAKKFHDSSSEINGIKILQDLQISFSDIDELEKKLAEEILAKKNLEILEKYCAWAIYCDEGLKFHKDGALFTIPKKIDHQNLIKSFEIHHRDGFDLTDLGFSLNKAQGESHYCIFCHNQKKDSCKRELVIMKKVIIKFLNY